MAAGSAYASVWLALSHSSSPAVAKGTPKPCAGNVTFLKGSGAQASETTLLCQGVVITLPPQRLPGLLGKALPMPCRERLQGLGNPSGALVFYGACDPLSLLPEDCPLHMQMGTGPTREACSFRSAGMATTGRLPDRPQ